MNPSSQDPVISPMLPGERRTVGAVSVIAMLRMLGLFALLPVLSPYAASLDGATPMLIGLAVGIYGLTQAGLQVPLGALSDRIGRKPVIVCGLIVFALGSIVAALADTISGVVLGRALQGAGAISAALTALVADLTRPQVRTRSMAFVGVSIGGAFVLAMVFGPVVATIFGVRALFVFGVVAAIAGITLLALVPARETAPVASGRWDLRRAIRPELLRLDFYVFLLHAMMIATFVALPFLFTSRLSVPLSSQWKLYIGAILVSLLGTVPLVLYDDRRGRRRTVGIAVLFLIAGQAVLAFAAVTWGAAFAGLALLFAGINFLEAGLPSRLSLLADEASRGAALGVFSTSQFLGAFAGGLIGGRLLGSGEPRDVFFAGFLLALTWLAAHGLVRRKSEA